MKLLFRFFIRVQKFDEAEVYIDFWYLLERDVKIYYKYNKGAMQQVNFTVGTLAFIFPGLL